MEVADPLPEHQRLADVIRSSSHLFMTGSEEIQSAALAAAKVTFDNALKQEITGFNSIKHFVRSLTSASSSQPRETRAQKQSRTQDGETMHPKMNSMLETANKLEQTPLIGLFTDGMGTDQLWSQLELRAKGICELVDLVFEGEYPDPAAAEQDSSQDDDAMELDEEELEGWDMEKDDESSEELEGDAEEEESTIDDNLGEHITPLSGGPESHATPKAPSAMKHSKSVGDGSNNTTASKRRGPRHPTLDDDFFSISDFNREIDTAEAKSSSRGKLRNDDDTEDDESVDLFAEVPDDESEEAEEEEDGGASAVYTDFFDAPATLPKQAFHNSKSDIARTAQIDSDIGDGRKSRVRFHEEVKVKLVQSRRNPNSLLDMDDEDDEDGSDDELPSFDEGWDDEDEDEDENEDEDEDADERSETSEELEQESALEQGFDTVERAKNDLFADEESAESDLSSFAQRQLTLKKQIEELEQENVGEKDWALMGEASSRSRPVNSLLEEDLDFEHRQRVAPVITEEKVQSLEALIKARILEGRYDDVVRRRAFDDKPFLPSRIFELQDTKSAQSLAQIYEDEYTATKSGGTVDDRDGKLKKEHEELEALWEGISMKLDALCNAHFTPKSARGQISTVSNAPSTTLESALPTAKASSSLLAPEEIFATRAPGVVASKAEMTSQEKQAQRLKARKSRAKMRTALEVGVDKYAKLKQKGALSNSDANDKTSRKNGKMAREKEEKAAALKSIVKSGKGVTVVGKGSGKKR